MLIEFEWFSWNAQEQASALLLRFEEREVAACCGIRMTRWWRITERMTEKMTGRITGRITGKMIEQQKDDNVE